MIAMSVCREIPPPAGMLRDIGPAWRIFFLKCFFFGKFIRPALTVNGMAEASLPFIALSLSILAIIGILLIIAGKKGTEQNSTYLPRPCPVYY